MNKSNQSIFLKVLFLLGLVAVQPALALEFECSNDGDVRFIRQELPGISNLCEVTVTNAKNERQVMWYANHDTMFCSEKTIELKTKYEEKWGFACNQWPDHDGVDTLSKRQRTILDAELKFLIEAGTKNSKPFLVEGLKAAANKNKQNTMVVQFFLFEPGEKTTRDVTHIIKDNGVSWNTVSRIDTLSKFIESDEGFEVNAALISAVDDAGSLEVITVLEAENSTEAQTANCYGNQTLATNVRSKLVPRTPHRYICPDDLKTSDAG